jgi:hypothetical protein
MGVMAGAGVGAGEGVGEGEGAGPGAGAGAPVHTLKVVAVLRGAGAAVMKSAPLASVSVQPPSRRSTAVVLLGAAVGALPSKVPAVPKPTKSMMVLPVADAVVKGVVLLTSATLPAVPEMAMVPTLSAVGKLVVPPVPAASCTR